VAVHEKATRVPGADCHGHDASESCRSRTACDEFPGRRGSHFMIPASDPTRGRRRDVRAQDRKP
jgi:hypothetical protein